MTRTQQMVAGAIHDSLSSLGKYISRPFVQLMAAVSVLALLAMIACGDSMDDAVPTPTEQSVMFATPPAATSTGVDDESGSDIDLELNQTATPYPTATLYPTATPYPVAVSGPESTPGSATATVAGPTAVPSAGPTIRISIPKKSEVKLPKADSAINSLVDRVEAGEITAEEAAAEAPLHRGESVGVIILLFGNAASVLAFLEATGRPTSMPERTTSRPLCQCFSLNRPQSSRECCG